MDPWVHDMNNSQPYGVWNNGLARFPGIGQIHQTKPGTGSPWGGGGVRLGIGDFIAWPGFGSRPFWEPDYDHCTMFILWKPTFLDNQERILMRWEGAWNDGPYNLGWDLCPMKISGRPYLRLKHYFISPTFDSVTDLLTGFNTEQWQATTLHTERGVQSTTVVNYNLDIHAQNRHVPTLVSCHPDGKLNNSHGLGKGGDKYQYGGHVAQYFYVKSRAPIDDVLLHQWYANPAGWLGRGTEFKHELQRGPGCLAADFDSDIQQDGTVSDLWALEGESSVDIQLHDDWKVDSVLECDVKTTPALTGDISLHRRN